MRSRICIAVAFAGLFLTFIANAQNSSMSTVSVVASDPLATEPGDANVRDTGTFTISRHGPTNMQLLVFFILGGTGLNGVDYAEIQSPVTIPAGERAARVTVDPVADSLVEGEERVILRLAPSPLMGPMPTYILPTNSPAAVVTIRDNDRAPANLPPMVQIVRPPNGARFTAPADIHIVADTVDRDGWVGTVEFFANGAKIGESVINFIQAPPDGTPIVHEFNWKGVRAGEYSLTARGTDDEGATSTSMPVRISVTDSNSIPPRTVVSIRATDPVGSEIPEVPPGMGRPQLIDPAIFSVSRTGILTDELTVYYTVGGTAQNGVDYVEIPGQVQIPAGARSAEIEISVIDDELVEGTETVTIRIDPPVCIAIYPPPPDCYLVGEPGRAEASIRDNDSNGTNRPPTVSIVLPEDGAVFVAPADIEISAQAFDSDGYVHTVEFFEGTNSLGVAANNPFSANIRNPFHIKWPAVPPGDYVLTAVATDNDGAQSRSRPVRIKVIEEPVRQTVVNIRAIDPEAAEQDPRLDSLPNNALLRVTRSGATDFALSVFYAVGGTADNGIDYQELKGEVIIPEGSESADIIIEAIDDKIVERTESVIVSIRPPVCPAIWPPPRECYAVGPAGRASAFILDDDVGETNRPPHIEITRPASGTTFRSPADILIVANTVDRDGYTTMVEFFANNHKIGEASKHFVVPPADGTPIEYEFEWRDVRPGQYALTARATDEEGATSTSLPVRVTVVGTNEPPNTNVAVVTVVATDSHASEGPIIWHANSAGHIEPLGTNRWPNNIIIRPLTNTATFEIRRSGGDLATSLRVFYETHGTATDGVDYDDLPGVVEIPAGQRAARVVVVPIDDRLPEKLESVVLCLRPSPVANPLPGYVVGRPASAAAVIADNDFPRLPVVCLRDGIFQWCRPAANGECFRIECSTDLREWIDLGTVSVTEGAIHYVDADAPANDRRFYRAVPVPCPAE